MGSDREVRAVCLLSGGLDSAVTAAIAKYQGYEVYALTFNYGQRHKREVESAKEIARWLGAVHKIFDIDLNQFGGSALTDKINVPEGKTIDEIRDSDEIPVTYVPARNTIFLSIALAYAEVIDADAIFIGAHAIDYSGYPDCRPDYFDAFQRMANLATKQGVENRKIDIKTPLIELEKADIIRKGNDLKVPFEHTWSCYKGGDIPCGVCDSCVIRINGFKEAGLEDPLEYENGIQSQ